MTTHMGSGNPDSAPAFPKRLAFTRDEVAQLLGVAPITIFRLTKRGLLHANRSTRRPLYSQTEIERFLSTYRD